MAAILNLAILDSAILVFPLKFTHTCQDWFPPFAQKTFHSFILTQFDDGSHLEFCHLGFSHISIFSQIHSHLPRLVPTICTKQTSLIHSESTWWWQPSWILPCLIQTLLSWIQTPCYLLSDSPKNTLTPLWLWFKLIQSDSNSFSPFKVTHTCQDCFPPFAQKNFTHSLWLNLMMAAILNSAMLDWDTAILDSTPSYLLSDSLKNTLTPLWLWLKLIQSDSNSFILT